jgi:hypothetical protein
LLLPPKLNHPLPPLCQKSSQGWLSQLELLVPELLTRLRLFAEDISEVTQRFLCWREKISLREEGAAKYIGNIPKEGNKPNAEIEDDVKIHFRHNLKWKAAFNLLACLEHHDGHECIKYVANAGEIVNFVLVISLNTYPGINPMTLLQPNLIP